MATKPKGLKKAQTFHQHFKNSAKYLSGWNNSTITGAHIVKMVTIFTINLYNLKFKDLNLIDIKQIGRRTDKTYFLVLLTLSLHGKMSKTGIISILNLSFDPAAKIIDQYTKHGYFKEVSTRRQHFFLGKSRMKNLTEVELTSKGYDLLNHIFSILIDDSFL